MAIVDAYEIGVRNGEVELGDILRRKYERTFHVTTSGHTVGMLEVMVALGVNYGDTYSEDDGALVRRVTCTQFDRHAPKEWHATVFYDTETEDPESASTAAGGGGGGGGGAPQETNPINKPAVVSWGSRTETRPIRKDIINGKPICNTAGSLFELQHIEHKITTLTIVQNQLSFNPFEVEDYKGKLNGFAFQTRPDRTVLCRDITASSEFSNNLFYYKVTYNFEFAPFNEPNFWKLVLVDKGRKYLQPAPLVGVLVPITYTAPEGMTGEEIFLNGVDGKKHDSFSLTTGLMATNAEPATIAFNTHETIDFGVLDLPDPAF